MGKLKTVFSYSERSFQKCASEKEIQLEEIPLIFLRLRNLEQFQHFCKKLNPEQASILSGFVFPKFYSSNAACYLKQLASLNKSLDVQLYFHWRDWKFSNLSNHIEV